MIIRPPETTAEFEQYYDLRWRVLRAPLGLPKGSEKDALESESFHLGVFDMRQQLQAVAKFKPSNAEQVQISHVAVEENARGEGYGRRLLSALEAEAKRRGHRGVFLTAREYNIPYFEKLGYRLGEEAAENPLPDIKIFFMFKDL